MTSVVPLRVLVAGPIGSGKSTVLRRLADLGAQVIEADKVGHDVLEPGGEAHARVVATWPRVVGADDRIDRSALARIVFADPEELQALESITHPAIAARIAASVDASEADVVAVEVPLTADFLGDGWHRIVVVAPEETRIARAVARGMDEPDVRRRVASQPTEEEWTAVADTLIVNDADEPALLAAIDNWWTTHTAPTHPQD